MWVGKSKCPQISFAIGLEVLVGEELKLFKSEYHVSIEGDSIRELFGGGVGVSNNFPQITRSYHFFYLSTSMQK